MIILHTLFVCCVNLISDKEKVTRLDIPTGLITLYGICLNPHDDCLYICDATDHTIKKITKQGIYKSNSIKLSCTNRFIGNVTTFAKVMDPRDIVMNYTENTFFVVCQSHDVKKISSSGIDLLLI